MIPTQNLSHKMLKVFKLKLVTWLKGCIMVEIDQVASDKANHTYVATCENMLCFSSSYIAIVKRSLISDFLA